MGWIALSFTMLEVAMIAHRDRNGWLVGVFASMLWIVAGWRGGMMEVVVVNAIFIVLKLHGWRKWKTDRRTA